MGVDGGTFLRRKQVTVSLITQDCKTGLFCHKFCAEGIRHTYRAISNGAHNRVIHTHSVDQFAAQHALVHHVDSEVACPQVAITIFKPTRIGKKGTHTSRLEMYPAHLVLREGWHISPIDNPDLRQILATPLSIGIKQ